MFKSEMDKLAEDLKMTPEQIRQAIKDGVDLKTKATTLETELNASKTSLETMRGEFDGVKNKLNEIEANSRRQPPSKNEPKTYTSIVDDEDKAFNERLADGVAPVAMAAVKAGSNAARLEARLSLEGK